MKTSKRVILFLIPGIFLCFSLFAQVKLSTLTTNAGGNSFIGEDINIEWSIGEMAAVNTSVNSSIIVSKGVLQPQRFRIYSPTTELALKIYPTLTTDNSVQLTGRLLQPSVIKVTILNSIGQLISSFPLVIPSNLVNEKIAIPDHYKGSLFIEVSGMMEGEIEINKKTFRIQKF